ncbi:MipA/OmpV family protein [Roseomonas sp. JC162]|uniref:MipA/OmpV family protein n=1 Tax=Neoroseomonas marina TaxID=1232220 RepID=A0A848E9U9_9PROT|nr:MipA/OmpV family protein [Neoroseomonas marina]NMJ40243.1 MipA/OmpV family protein [Neoroseomonas marina]
MTRDLRCRAAGFALLLLASGAGAQVTPDDADGPASRVELNLGVGPLLFPAYPGSHTYRVEPLPYLSGHLGDRIEFETFDGLRITAWEDDGFSFGAAAIYRFGRRTSDDRAHLTGLRSFSDTVELGGFVSYETGPFLLDATLTQDPARSHGGAVLEFRALWNGQLGPLSLEAGPEVRLVSRAFAQSYFGIDARRAIASARPAYDASAGFERVGIYAQSELPLGGGFALRGLAEYGRLVGSAAGSPIVTGPGGSPNEVYLGAFLTWRFF